MPKTFETFLKHKAAGDGRYKGWKAAYRQANALEKPARPGIIKAGAVSGALDPESVRADEHAKRYYQAVRKMKTDVKRIAKNTGYPEHEIRRIKKFVFMDMHDLGDGRISRFDPSFELAESWQRLIDGKDIQPHDLTLLQHEMMEHDLMEQGYTQDEAHRLASAKFNYRRECLEYYGNIGQNKKD